MAEPNRTGGGTFKYKRSGRARAGWWPAWMRLGVRGMPRGTSPGVLAKGEGSFVDGRKDSNPFFELINEVSYIDSLEEEDAILETSLRGRTEDMEAVSSRRYGSMLKRFSA